jgi:hypothetical protein
MASHPRELIFNRIEPGNELSARCGTCDRTFVVTADREDRMDNLILRLREEFAKHNCNGAAPGERIKPR